MLAEMRLLRSTNEIPALTVQAGFVVTESLFRMRRVASRLSQHSKKLVTRKTKIRLN
jgi:hypothetical protein